MEERISFYAESEEPIRLEGVLHLPGSGDPDAPLVILCHPHPIGGGSMDVALIVDPGRTPGHGGLPRPPF